MFSSKVNRKLDLEELQKERYEGRWKMYRKVLKIRLPYVIEDVFGIDMRY